MAAELSAETRERMAQAAKRRAQRIKEAGGQTSIENQTSLECENCGRQMTRGHLTRHQRSCFSSLQDFVQKHSHRLIVDQQSGCVTLRNNSRLKPALGDGRRISRVVLELFHGEPLNHLHALHTCDNPSCLNWWHLWGGTHADNMADRTAKKREGRHAAHVRWHVNRDYPCTCKNI